MTVKLRMSAEKHTGLLGQPGWQQNPEPSPEQRSISPPDTEVK